MLRLRPAQVMATVEVRPDAGGGGGALHSLKFWDRAGGSATYGQPYLLGTLVDQPHRCVGGVGGWLDEEVPWCGVWVGGWMGNFPGGCMGVSQPQILGPGRGRAGQPPYLGMSACSGSGAVSAFRCIQQFH